MNLNNIGDNIAHSNSAYIQNNQNGMDLDDLVLTKKYVSDYTTVTSECNTTKTNQIFGVIRSNKNDTSPSNLKSNYKEKVKIPFLKKFNPKSIKREEIDKKIIRKFKKYLKEKLKTKNSFENNNINLNFWKDFTTKNLLPPMAYKINEETFEFKSFNSNYIVWLFSQSEAVALYNKFLEENKEDLYESIKQMIKVTITEDIIIELTNIYEYIQNYSQIFCIKNNNNSNNNDNNNNHDNNIEISNNNINSNNINFNNNEFFINTKIIQESNHNINQEKIEIPIVDNGPSYNNDIFTFSNINEFNNNNDKNPKVNCFEDIDFFKK